MISGRNGRGLERRLLGGRIGWTHADRVRLCNDINMLAYHQSECASDDGGAMRIFAGRFAAFDWAARLKGAAPDPPSWRLSLGRALAKVESGASALGAMR
jgi:hypothetical protein